MYILIGSDGNNTTGISKGKGWRKFENHDFFNRTAKFNSKTNFFFFSKIDQVVECYLKKKKNYEQNRKIPSNAGEGRMERERERGGGGRKKGKNGKLETLKKKK